MYQLTEQQIDYILDDIRSRGVTMEDLQQSLLDHACCLIEEGLEEDGDFEQFYQTTIRAFYVRELGEIEKETRILLHFKNYYKMRKLMILAGAAAALMLITGSFFKIMHWPATGVLLIGGILTFAFVFVPIVALMRIREQPSAAEKLVTGLAALCGMLYCYSMVSILHHWEGTRVIWLITQAFAFFVLAPVYFLSGMRRDTNRNRIIVNTVLLVAAICVHFALTDLRPKNRSQQDTTPADQQAGIKSDAQTSNYSAGDNYPRMSKN